MTSTSRSSAVLAGTAALALLALTACGQGGSSSPGDGSASGSVSDTGTPTAPSGRPATVVLTRTGGLAGFSDKLDVAPDGTVTGTTKAGVVSCRVDEAVATTLVNDPPPTVAPAAGTDRVTVTLDRLGKTADLGEAQGSDALSAAARSLLDDVQQPEDARTVCR